MAATVNPGVLEGIVNGLKSIGYGPQLIAEPYSFTDWFAHGEVVHVEAAAFGQTPWDYDTACVGIVRSRGYSGKALINRCRALGAPFVLEIDGAGVNEWAVARKKDNHQLVCTYQATELGRLFENRAPFWKPEELLREKNIGQFTSIQGGLFDGLVPELEEKIQAKLDPLLTNTLTATSEAYKSSTASINCEPNDLFKLIFWLLTAKVFHDRSVTGFESLGPDADACLDAVSEHYATPHLPRPLNKIAREVAANRIWDSLDFRNLSVEVLAQIWSTTLVDKKTRESLGIHRTPRSIVKYLTDLVSFDHSGDEELIILEPCCGSSAFLIGAMNRLRKQLYFSFPPDKRHNYFVRLLAGIEQDPFSTEISFLALTLADFPNPNGWNITQGNVFDLEPLRERLTQAGVVLCNPPFGEFNKDEREKYDTRSHRKPAELLHRILDHLHPRGVLGFVLPRAFVDGSSYADIRTRLAKRFEKLDITILPDRAFPSSDSEIALLAATNPIPHRVSRVINKRVNDDQEAWIRFQLTHTISSENNRTLTAVEARSGVAVPEFQEVWDFMLDFPTLSEVALLHRGIEWKQPLTKNRIETGYRSKVVRTDRFPDSHVGIAPRTSFNVFEVPRTFYLDVSQENMRGNAYQLPWNEPKVIVNKATKSRGHWRIAALPDTLGITCYQTYTAVWPTSAYDEWVLAAILNSPVANIFVCTREGKRDIRVKTLRQIPIPILTASQSAEIGALVKRYQYSVKIEDWGEAAHTLMKIDAGVLDGYRMPPRLEREILDFFRGHNRITPFKFPPYFADDFDMYFNLSDYLSDDFRLSTAGELARRMAL